MINCIILDDDLMSRKNLEILIAKHRALGLKGAFSSVPEALAFLEKGQEQIDLVFLDIEMPGMSGLAFLEQSPFLLTVIFTSSNQEYAFDAFEYNAVDFLKKPILWPRFEQAVGKSIEFIQVNSQKTAENLRKTRDIYIKDEGFLVRVPSDEILYFEHIGDYVRVKTQKKQYLVYSSLKSVYEKLDDVRFIKVHRSFIINLDKIKNIDENSLVIESAVIPISRAHKAALLGRLKVL
jgi:DNA-binding LytR/AlgR family response regulator